MYYNYRNVCSQLYNFSKCRHLEDAISIDRIIKELKLRKRLTDLRQWVKQTINTSISIKAAAIPMDTQIQ